jgi:hypothetical protein
MIFASGKKKEEVVYLQGILYAFPYLVALVMDWHADREEHSLCTLLYYTTTLLYIIVRTECHFFVLLLFLEHIRELNNKMNENVTVTIAAAIILGVFPAMQYDHPAAATSTYAQDLAGRISLLEDEEEEEPEEEDGNASSSSDFNIAAVGDWGCTPNTEDTVDNIISKSPEVVLGLGDNSYTDSADCWYEVVDPIIDKMITAIGNHEHERPGEGGDPAIPLPEKLDETMNRFGLSEQYYTYRYGNVFVLVMSTEIPYDEDSEQFDFVERSLSEASSDPDVDWIIVMHHRLMYTSPSATTESSGLTETYHRLFEEHDVDLVLQGHVHSYERSVPIVYKVGEADFPIPTSTNGETYVDPEGQIFATVGTGGHSIHEFQGMNYYIQKQYEGYGFLDIEIKNGEDGGGKRLVGTFYDNDGGGIQDQFTVIKRGT